MRIDTFEIQLSFSLVYKTLYLFIYLFIYLAAEAFIQLQTAIALENVSLSDRVHLSMWLKVSSFGNLPS